MIDDRITVRFKKKKEILDVCKKYNVTPSHLIQLGTDNILTILKHQPTLLNKQQQE